MPAARRALLGLSLGARDPSCNKVIFEGFPGAVKRDSEIGVKPLSD
jgi:hypothetical protein